MEEKQLSEFLGKFSRNQHTEQEHELFLTWLHSLNRSQAEKIMDMYQAIAIPNEGQTYAQLAEKIEDRLNALANRKDQAKVTTLWPLLKYAAVACILIICAVLGFHFSDNTQKDPVLALSVKPKVEIIQGSNKAVLSLANGAEIILDAAKVGKLAHQGHTAIYKAKNGQLVFDASGLHADNTGKAIVYNTLTIPRGGQYVVKLPDGSTVWLNSASSLKFPAFFAGKERVVELTGEAYFEVAKDKTKPFRVKTATQNVEVLGTHFNINAYTDEPLVATTLLEGSVKVSKLSTGETQLLKPGQQSRIGGSIAILDVDPDQYVDWKDGYFKFSRENIQSIMRKVSRWYDVDVSYEGRITKEGFVGTVPRSKDITEVLNALKLTGVMNYRIEGKKVIIIP